MTELTLGVAIACGIVGVAALFMFRERVESVGRNGIKLRPPPPPKAEPPQFEAMLATEQRHRDHESQVAQGYETAAAQLRQTIAENDKVIKRLTILNTVKDKDIVRLTASNAEKDTEIARLKEQIPKPPATPRRIDPGATPYDPGSTFGKL